MIDPRASLARQPAIGLAAVLAIGLSGCVGAPADATGELASASVTPSSPAVADPLSPSDVPGPSLAPVLTESAVADLIEPDALRLRLEAFQAIADANGGTRATGSPGFDASVEYVAQTLEASGYDVIREPLSADGSPTMNLLAERAGTGNGIVVLGAHLDSVAVGPGINDNATGVAALLTVAEALTHFAPPDATVRFAFWGAEEGGPFGSAAHVAGLEDTERRGIRSYLNFDMLGSPNGVTFVYDEVGAAPGSDALTALVARPFARRGLPWEPIDLSGDSDHGPFTAAGIPTGGLFAGGREPVTDAQAARHGAVAGEPADPCSHAACDTIDNVDLARLGLMTDAIAAIVVSLVATPQS